MSESNGVKGNATIAENKALANKGRGFPFKRVFFALLIVLIIFSILLLVANIVV